MLLSEELTGRACRRDGFDLAAGQAELSHDEVLRATGVVALIGVAVIHFAQVVPTIHQSASLGWAFVLLSVACVAVAGQLVYRGTARAWVQVGVLNLLIVAGFAFTRLFSTAFDNQDVGNWSETLGMAALFVEGVLVLASAYAITAGRLARRGGAARIGVPKPHESGRSPDEPGNRVIDSVDRDEPVAALIAAARAGTPQPPAR